MPLVVGTTVFLLHNSAFLNVTEVISTNRDKHFTECFTYSWQIATQKLAQGKKKNTNITIVDLERVLQVHYLHKGNTEFTQEALFLLSELHSGKLGNSCFLPQ